MFAEKTRIRFFVAPVVATVIALACYRGQVFAESIAEKNSGGEFEANDVEPPADPEPTDSAYTVAWFDTLVLGDKSDAASLRVRFENLLEKKVSAAQRICALSDRGRRKLLIAG